MLERCTANNRSEALTILRQWLPHDATEGFRRLEIALPACEPLGLDLYPRVQWISRDNALAIEAAGCALQAELPTWGRMGGLEQELRGRVDPESAASLRWFLWGRFDATTDPEAEWQSYGTRRLLLPSLEMRRERDRCLLACNCNTQGLPALRAALSAPTLPGPAEAFGCRDAGSTPNRGDWDAQVARVQHLLEEGTPLQKVVLARRASWTVEWFDPARLLARAAELQPASYRLLIQPDPKTAFLALSPERLYRRDGEQIESEALAGTRPRGGDESADAALGKELLESEKDRREQQLVLDQILDALQPLTTTLDADSKPHLRRLREVQHLCNRVEGILRTGVGDGDLLAALHPTPAVAGQPPREARETIAALEPFDRGLYAGPVGCCSAEQSEVAVAIRSALWHDGRLHLYAGAGLLPASDAEAEWNETRDKMALLGDLLRHRSGKAVS